MPGMKCLQGHMPMPSLSEAQLRENICTDKNKKYRIQAKYSILKCGRKSLDSIWEKLSRRNSAENQFTQAWNRRSLILSANLGLLALTFTPIVGSPAGALVSNEDFTKIESLLSKAMEAWDRGLDPTNLERFRYLYQACDIFSEIISLDPDSSEWLEARGQVEVDSKRFTSALQDFTESIERDRRNYRAYASRALAYEGLAQWEDAINDYSTALKLGQEVTGSGPEPYVMNSRGNAYVSLGKFKEALKDYEESTKIFQSARELDGAIYSASNAALIKIELGEVDEGVRELSAVARRAPASIDMRAALAAIYWSQGNQEKAEEEWRFACDNINAGQLFDGCAKYRDMDWLKRIRRWPPSMVERMDNFIRLQ